MEILKTRQRLRILELLAQRPNLPGLEVAMLAQLKVGTVYGILMTFEDAGFVVSKGDESRPGKPGSRRFYRLTEAGLGLLADYQAYFGPEESLGLFATVNRGLHEAIEQVWGGIFQLPVRRERERQEAARQRV